MKKLVGISLFLIFIVFMPVLAQNYPTDSVVTKYKWDRFSVNFGGFVSGLNSDINLGSQQLGLGVSINLENALGLETNSLVLRGEAEYAFGKTLRHSTRLSYYGFLRSATKVLADSLQIGDVVFSEGTILRSKFNLEIFKVDYAYALYMDERVKINATIGFFVMPLTFSVKADDDKNTAAKFTAPLPAIGFRTYYAVTPRFYITQNFEMLYMKIGSFTGSMVDVNFKAEYKPWNHFGVGAGINTFKLSVIKTGPDTYLDFEGSVKTGYTGLLFYAKYFF